MGFEGAFRKVLFGRKPSGPATTDIPAQLHPALTAELQRLDLYRRGLGDAAIRYVATGARPDVIEAIAAAAKAQPIHVAPYHKQTNELHLAASDTAFAVATGAMPAGPEIPRLMQIRLATGYFTVPYWRKAPPEQHALHAFLALLNGGLSRLQSTSKSPWDTIIPLPRVLDHLRHVGGTMLDLFVYLLGRDGAQIPVPGSWHASAECGSYITTYPVAFAEALRNGQPQQRLRSINLARHHGACVLPEIERVLLEMLDKPFGKDDHEIAISALAQLDERQLLALIERELPQAGIPTRAALAQAAGRNGSRRMLEVLAEHAKRERAASVKSVIEAILEADGIKASGSAQSEAGYAATDGSFVALPPLALEGPTEAEPVSDEDCIAFMRVVEAIVAHRSDLSEESCDRTRFYHRLDKDDIEAAFELMTRGTPLPAGKNYTLVSAIRQREDGRAWYAAFLDGLPVDLALSVLMANRYGELQFLIGASTYVREPQQFGLDRLERWIAEHGIGLREIAIADHASKTGLPLTQAASDPGFDATIHLRELLGQWRANYDRRDVFQSLRDLPHEAVWPWLAENMKVLDEGLGLQPALKPIGLDRTLALLGLLPKIPQRYFPKLLEIAVTEKRPLRRQAMALLRDAKDLAARIEALLDDARQQVRINAATWLADIRSAASEGAMRKRLKKEKSEPVRAALIESLQRLGADLADVIGPASLIAEAEKAFAKTAPALPTWLIGSGLPTLHFRDGSTVPALVVRHWLALAVKLKDPGASGQFGIYLDQLDPGNARALSNWVLESWIAYDTHSSSLEEATAYAMANYQQHYSWMYRAAKTPELRDQVIAEMIRQKTGELLNSGADTKGMLGLACRADPVWAANRVRWFLKKHGRRSNQAMALLEVLAGIGQPAALQVVIAASARLKQKSTQARAAEIAERYAEDRGWSFDDLSDRTVPTAGFDDDGTLELPCGEDDRIYAARLDATLAIHLFNPDGKPIKSLPAGDDEATKESKKAFSASKKELAQVIELQGTRLFEAMCVERAWPVADWRMAFHEHAVMRRLVERLVWQGLDDEGNPLGLFRPTQEGDFTDAADAEVDIDRLAKVRLAHGALVDEDTCKAWTAHLKDYEIKPFLAQFGILRAPLSAEQADAEALFDRQGWKADSRSFRGAAEKRGYERVMRDGGGCHEYEKTFASHGITATIFHTGSHAVDENNPVALKDLRFARQGHRGAFRLKDVPPVMLAECWADYHAVAAKGAFDPDWEKIAPW